MKLIKHKVEFFNSKRKPPNETDRIWYDVYHPEKKMKKVFQYLRERYRFLLNYFPFRRPSKNKMDLAVKPQISILAYRNLLGGYILILLIP